MLFAHIDLLISENPLGNWKLVKTCLLGSGATMLWESVRELKVTVLGIHVGYSLVHSENPLGNWKGGSSLSLSRMQKHSENPLGNWKSSYSIGMWYYHDSENPLGNWKTCADPIPLRLSSTWESVRELKVGTIFIGSLRSTPNSENPLGNWKKIGASLSQFKQISENPLGNWKILLNITPNLIVM